MFQTEAGQYEVYTEGKDGVILFCETVQKRVLKPFEEVKSQVSSDYYKKQAQQELEIMAEQAYKQVVAGKDFNEVAHSFGAHAETAYATYKDGSMDLAAILRRPEISNKIKVLQSKGAMITVEAGNECFVIRLDEIAKTDELLFKDKKSTIESTLASQAKYKGRDSFVALLYRHAKLNKMIEIREQLLKDIKDTEL